MKTIIKTYEGYTFDELSDSAKQTAVSDYAESLDWEWWACSYDNFIEDMAKLGIEIDIKEKRNHNGYVSKSPKIYFSGFYSQGGGASFEASINVIDFIKAHGVVKEYWKLYLNLIKYNCYLSINIGIRSPHYSHSGTMYLSQNSFDYDNWDHNGDIVHVCSLEQQADDLAQYILETCQGYADDLYDTLEKEYEYLTSEESVKETAEANEWYFNERGKVIW